MNVGDQAVEAAAVSLLVCCSLHEDDDASAYAIRDRAHAAIDAVLGLALPPMPADPRPATGSPPVSPPAASSSDQP